MVDKIEISELENTSTPLQDLMNRLEITNIAGAEELDALLNIPDDQFKLLSEAILEELEEGLRDPAQRYELQNCFKEAGVSMDELDDLKIELMDNFEEIFGNEYSELKVSFLKRFILLVLNCFSSAQNAADMLVGIPIELCHEDAKMPKYAHINDAAMDLYATEDYVVDPGQRILVSTGIKTAIPRGYALLVQPRSGISLKTGLRVANSVGLIDSGYRDEIKVIIENIEPQIKNIEYSFKDDGKIEIQSLEHGKSYTIEKGDRIAQLRLVQVPSITWTPVTDIHQISGDRMGGFGSSGMK